MNTTANALNPNAGLQKWSLSAGTWHLAYTLQNGLGLGVQYSIAGLDPSLYPATDGLRNLTGKVNRDGTVMIFAVTSTISNSGDQGADPNRLVSITDRLSARACPLTNSSMFWRSRLRTGSPRGGFRPVQGSRKTHAVWLDPRRPALCPRRTRPDQARDDHRRACGNRLADGRRAPSLTIVIVIATPMREVSKSS